MSEVERTVGDDRDLAELGGAIRAAVIEAIDDELDDDRLAPCEVTVSVDADVVDPSTVDEESNVRTIVGP